MFAQTLISFATVLTSFLPLFLSHEILCLFTDGSNSGLCIGNIPLTLEKIRKDFRKLQWLKRTHYGIILFYLFSITHFVWMILEEGWEHSHKLAFQRVGLSVVVVSYPIVYMWRLMENKEKIASSLLPLKEREVYLESMKVIEEKYFSGVQQDDMREAFSEFPVFPPPQLKRYMESHSQVGDGSDLLVHAWIQESMKIVQEYRKLCHESEK